MDHFSINQYDFNEKGKANLAKEKRGKDWPVVYLIHNDKELYIGETQNVFNRMEQHLKNPDRKSLKAINIIFDDEFNKSAILDIEIVKKELWLLWVKDVIFVLKLKKMNM